MSYQWIALASYAGEFYAAILLTLQVTVLAFGLGVGFGLLAAAAAGSRSRLLASIAAGYIELMRNTPMLLQIFIVFFGLPSLGVKLDAYTAGVIALGLNAGGFLAEIFRAGMASVPRGQLEAASILGLGRAQVFLHVVLPQAARAVYPAIVNNLIHVLLGTSLLSAIALPELTGVASVINSRTLLYVQTFAMTLLGYLIMSNAISLAAAYIGTKVFQPPVVTPRSSRLLERIA
ncbi:hypothetical protein CAL12_21150 [Bordetella genomosp. 8]|uniref:ABC transmembrane type-1 domain-containing protein n=1 Tax=Bordetella genomosp. 8 TaxID=1416806 RepID=A0A1W6YPP1_9BORD|nr:amino acid ABC transporter permease [Bordetella genomosp. 8]ARP83076.1 hypothetical protein CAL12_21150 [Bordetella genomosp. 8]